MILAAAASDLSRACRHFRRSGRREGDRAAALPPPRVRVVRRAARHLDGRDWTFNAREKRFLNRLRDLWRDRGAAPRPQRCAANELRRGGPTHYGLRGRRSMVHGVMEEDRVIPSVLLPSAAACSPITHGRAALHSAASCVLLLSAACRRLLQHCPISQLVAHYGPVGCV